MHIEGKMFEKENTPYGLAIEVVIADDAYDPLIWDTLHTTGGSYTPTVTWNELTSSYHLTADWDPERNWGDDFTSIERRLHAVIPESLISVRYERPNEPVYEEGALIDMET